MSGIDCVITGAHCITCPIFQETILHVSASTERLLLAAELMELKKPYNDGSLKEVTISDLDGFQNTGK